ncbi:MAG TPA: SUMF1/EgtB/PvdO family nonheme iron enzyme [Polyangia bacterium]|jgi:formylglycine-generating enzyme required for sulfatase activity|nr:SUMF1/EgtB/PvdO family nonheme iron enzyme [Polyangia bacterium]
MRNWGAWSLSSRKLLYVAAGVAAGVLFGSGFYWARAAGGVPTRAALSFVGTLTQGGGAAGPTALTFDFKKAGSVLCSPVVTVTPGTGGVFQAEIPIGGCPADLFDGRDVVVDVRAGGTVIAADQAINPVPYAKYADRAGQMDDPDCPLGYTKDPALPNPSNPMSVLCRRGPDEVVKVGTGNSAFWIDRYEATVNTLQDGTGSRNAVNVIPQNGQWTLTGAGAPPGYALSVANETPSTNITWFQASAFCAFSGKRLPTGEEWLRAAAGTPDPTAPSVSDGPCLTGNTAVRLTGLGTQCASHWGAQDMIGNAYEWTGEWFGSGGTTNGGWPVGYQGDGTYNVNSLVYGLSGGGQVTGPAAALRGGSGGGGTASGIFTINLGAAPAYISPGVGFRCVIPR